jgi:hypothetical protein
MSSDPSTDRPDPLPPDDQAIEATLAWLERARLALENLDSALGPAVGARLLRRDARQDIGLALGRAAEDAAKVLRDRDWVAAAQAVNLELTASVLRLTDETWRACQQLSRYPYRDLRANDGFLEQIQAGLKAPDHTFGQLAERLVADQARRQTQAVPPEGKTRPGMSLKEAVDRLERLRSQGERFTSQRELEKRIGCSLGTVCKALKETEELRLWSERPEASPRVVGQSRNPGPGAAERAAISREPNPADAAAEAELRELSETDAKLRELIEKNPDERAFCNEMQARASDEFVSWYTGQPPGVRRDIRQVWAEITTSDPDTKERFFTLRPADQIAWFDDHDRGPRAHPR